MKAPSVSLLRGLAVLLLSGPAAPSSVFLNASPNRLQFLTEESVSLRCEGRRSLAGWTVRRTAGGKTQKCGQGPKDFGSFDGSSCIMLDVSPLSDSGVYWCENGDGQKSPEVNITVSGVILEIPPAPVVTGSDVTLLCRTGAASMGTAYFSKNGVYIGSGSKGEFTISKVQRSDDGFYSCATDLTGSSSRSRLIVRDVSPTTPPLRPTLSPGPHPSPTPPPPPPLSSLLLPVVAALLLLIVLVLFLAGALLFYRKQAGLAVQLLSGLAVSAGLAVLLLSGLAVPSSGVLPAPSVSVVTLLCHLVVFCPYCISTILMVSIYCSRRTGIKRPASTEMAERAEGEDCGNITADVTTEHRV
ncbi:low affinity immunoglobulin gamma Fc region receptor II-b-like isoform X2 [Xiphias gladius]|uniref:low affinity immunoglobulin gamma Fc region receptor II-b-like isoform X2 n=1 Tax=Xiphias gladius TaxID=8245 RepID=UPI001A99C80B|nr:low affinity immunoglobulin gamma Fc region receptor II-b-like isoform X2 [Xiphias gladius]